MSTWKNILICFSIVSLSCALKNYFLYLWGASPFFEFLVPSFLGSHRFYVTPGFIELLYSFQQWVLESGSSLVALFFNDKYQVASILLIAPVGEEILYRLPQFMLRNSLSNAIFWPFAITLNAIFAHSHDLYGISLLPIFVLGMCSSWLIKKEQAFWPCILLHFFYNFYCLSFVLYQSLFGID